MSRLGQWIEAGSLVKPHGVKGEVIAELALDLCDFVVEELALRVTDSAGEEHTLEIERTRDHKGRKIIKFKGVETPEQAETLRGCVVWLARVQIGPLAEDRWFVQDILGVDVCTEEGEVLGKLADVMHMPANDVYVVRGAGGEILLPVIEDVILGVDLEAGRMVVRLMEGMR
jgi:16S rRNA processing protein RimM